MAAEKDNLDIPLIATVGIVSTVLTVACIIGVQALYNSYASQEIENKITLAPTATANSKLAEQNAKLASYGWADREQGKVVIPIERAMAPVVMQYVQRDEGAGTSSIAFVEVPESEAPDGRQ